MAVAWIDGIQGEGVGASLKHLAVNNQETRRMSVSAEVDERTLREVYLPAFEAAVKTSSPWTVMCSYNRINGTYASEHRQLLTGILRDEWGFDGFVVSDWAAVHDRPAALAAGLDLEMPGPRPRRVQAVVDAVRDGTLDVADVDQAVLRILRVVRQATDTVKGRGFDTAAHHVLARRIAADGMVLLKNEAMLPLSPTGRFAVIGRAAQAPRIQGGGSSQTTPTCVDVPLLEIERVASEAVVTYAAGYDESGADRSDLIAEAVTAAQDADAALLFVALPLSKESEGSDRTDLDLTPQQVALITAVAQVQPRTVVVMSSGSAVVTSGWVGQVPAVLQAWYAGQATGGAIADILFGIVNPSGKLAETFPLRLEDTPAYLNFPGEGDTVRYGEGLYIGYRWYDARRTAVSFPFGHGLSYTSFAYADARASANTVDESRGVTVLVDVTNTGARAGSEVVQVYVRDPQASVPRPEKELRGFDKVYLEPGETRTVAIELDGRAFALWDPRLRSWVVEPGRFDILIGSSSVDIRAELTVTAVTPDRLTSTLNEMSPLRDWLANQEARVPTIGLLRELAPIIGGVFGDGGEDPDALDPHFHSYFGTMPIRGVLEFAAPAGGPDPEARMAELAGEAGIAR
jgi:beta-glucosidase